MGGKNTFSVKQNHNTIHVKIEIQMFSPEINGMSLSQPSTL